VTAPRARLRHALDRRPSRRTLAAIAIAALALAGAAVALRLITGVGFANYDTLYALAWGGQLSRGSLPAYEVAIAPTPHPLVEALGVVLSPLSAGAIEDVTVALGFLALAGCAWVVYRLGEHWFGRAAGVLAALLLITRVPILSYGVRAYIDIPYLLLVLAALLVESRRPRAGAPVLALLALAGLLRPEAWAFSALYWLYLVDAVPWARARIQARAYARAWGRALRGEDDEPGRPPAAFHARHTRRQLAWLTLLAASAPLIWVLSDLAITGDPLWSLTNTRHTAHALDRVTGIANVPEYIPRRIGEILRPPVLVAAALGGVLSLLWLRRRALVGASAGVLAVIVFAAFATAGLPINTRYAFLASAILCVFAGAGVFGWTCLARGDRRRPWWMIVGALLLVALVASAPSQYRAAHREMRKLARQQSIQDELLALVHAGSINLACGPVGVPNHAPIPLLALYLHTSPRNIVSAQVSSQPISEGQYVDPASREVEEDYVLDPHDPHVRVTIPPGFIEVHSDASWLIFQRCS